MHVLILLRQSPRAAAQLPPRQKPGFVDAEDVGTTFNRVTKQNVQDEANSWGVTELQKRSQTGLK